MKNILDRLRRLEDEAFPQDCSWGATLVTLRPDDQLVYGDGRAFDPATAPVCPRCGETHVLVIEEVIVSSPEELLDESARVAGRSIAPE